MKNISSLNKKTATQLALLALAIIFALTGIVYWLRPTTIVNTAIENLGATDSQNFVARMQITNDATTEQIIGEPATINLEFAGTYARQETSRDSLQADFNVTVQTESLSMLIEGDVRFIDDQAYLLIEKTPPAFPPLVAIKDQWIILPRGGNNDTSRVANQEKLFAGASRTGRQEIDGRNIPAYEITATPAAILLFLDNIADVLGTRLTQAQVEQFRSGVASVQELPVTVAVPTFSRQLRYLATTIQLPSGNDASLNITFSKADADSTIQVPDGALTIEELAASASAR